MANAYLVRTKDTRYYTEPVLDDGTGPEVPCWPFAPVVAETPAQAKNLFLHEFAGSRSSGVEYEDWNDLRVSLLKKNARGPRGVHEERYSRLVDAAWVRIVAWET